MIVFVGVMSLNSCKGARSYTRRSSIDVRLEVTRVALPHFTSLVLLLASASRTMYCWNLESWLPSPPSSHLHFHFCHLSYTHPFFLKDHVYRQMNFTQSVLHHYKREYPLIFTCLVLSTLAAYWLLGTILSGCEGHIWDCYKRL